jgi:hypothetical protein
MKKSLMILGLAVMMTTATTLPVTVQAEPPAAEIKGQPHMKAALAALEAAQDELKKAKANKGGHRVAALKLVKEAIAEVKAGAEHAKAKKKAKKSRKKAKKD